MRILTASDRALLVELADLDHAIRAAAAWSELAEVDELVPGARTVLVHYDPLRVSAERLAELLSDADLSSERASHHREVTIAVHYDGADLDDVAALVDISTEQLIERHLAGGWQVAFAGFAPGFGYLAGSDPIFQVPRRPTPRTRVPVGSVALAGQFTGIYPRISPGGWQLIGRTDAVLWDLDRDPPALLTPGTTVHFVLADRDQIAVTATSTPVDKPATRTLAGPRLQVVSTPLPLLVQDQGRAGHAHLGVSRSGVADRTAAAQALRAVGNDPSAAVVECLGGAVLSFDNLIGDEVAVVTGADVDVQLTPADGQPRLIEKGRPFALAEADRLQWGFPRAGLRSVLAVRGGFDLPLVLQSASHDTLSGVGSAPLLAGDSVALAPARSAPALVDPHLPAARLLPAPGDRVELAITVGPREDWFDAEALHLLTGQDWRVTPQSDRIGIRLAGEQPLGWRVTAELPRAELPSEGVVTGAIQVPPDGQPVLFLPDHPLTGGYPIIAAVVDDDLDLVAQLPPGALVRFTCEDGP